MPQTIKNQNDGFSRKIDVMHNIQSLSLGCQRGNIPNHSETTYAVRICRKSGKATNEANSTCNFAFSYDFCLLTAPVSLCCFSENKNWLEIRWCTLIKHSMWCFNFVSNVYSAKALCRFSGHRKIYFIILSKIKNPQCSSIAAVNRVIGMQ